MQIMLNLPDDFDLPEFDLKMYIGVSLYEKGLMSSGFAAEILGIDRYTFIENMGKYGKSILELPIEQIKEDARVARESVR